MVDLCPSSMLATIICTESTRRQRHSMISEVSPSNRIIQSSTRLEASSNCCPISHVSCLVPRLVKGRIQRLRVAASTRVKAAERALGCNSIGTPGTGVGLWVQAPLRDRRLGKISIPNDHYESASMCDSVGRVPGIGHSYPTTCFPRMLIVYGFGFPGHQNRKVNQATECGSYDHKNSTSQN
ncbi:hypothetical protein VN12_04030 [Pirellula sp. SH-Sr6A]|nr:hypothetical protein VN12_04030 [Pirellula sp. SH-Sr6A]